MQITIHKKINKYFLSTFSHIEKRIRFVIATFAMTALMVLATIAIFQNQIWIMIPVLMGAAYVATYFSILEGIEDTEWTTLFLMPVLITVAFFLFYFLFPVRWLTRLPFLFIFGFSFYAMVLVSNIFNVGVEKSLQLLRAAFSVNYFYQIFTLFLLLIVFFSFKMNFIVNGIALFLLSYPLSLQLLWSVKLNKKIDQETIRYSLFISFVMMQIAIVCSFIPLKSTIYALFLTSCYYVLSGATYHFLDQKLFKQTIREYLFVLGFVAVIVLLSVQW